MTRGPFVLDDFTRRHLLRWFEAGYAPNDWTLADLAAFEDWVEDNAADLYDDESWSGLVRYYETINIEPMKFDG